LTPDMIEGIRALLDDGGIKAILKQRDQLQIPDSADYFFENLEKCCQKDYVPTDDDMLCTRASTTGILESIFVIHDQKFVIIDVGGQRSERKKWIHCFEEVNCILFIVGTSEFDQTLYEDNTTNRLHESKKIFHEICRSKWFTNTMVILFLNKSDIFTEKIKSGKSIKTCFPEYSGLNGVEPSLQFIADKFCDIVDTTTNTKKDIVVHTTTATNTHNIQLVWESVYEHIIRISLGNGGKDAL